jgi:hypothetical protein
MFGPTKIWQPLTRALKVLFTRTMKIVSRDVATNLEAILSVHMSPVQRHDFVVTSKYPLTRLFRNLQCPT